MNSISTSTKKRRIKQSAEQALIQIQSRILNQRVSSENLISEGDSDTIYESIVISSETNVNEDYCSSSDIISNSSDDVFNSSISSDSEGEVFCTEFEDTNTDTLSNKLVTWALEFNIPHTALNKLLTIVDSHVSDDIPKDARTLLQTSRKKVAIVDKCGGEYFYFGIKKNIMKLLEVFLTRKINCIEKSSSSSQIKLNIGIDGLPISKSR